MLLREPREYISFKPQGERNVRYTGKIVLPLHRASAAIDHNPHRNLDDRFHGKLDDRARPYCLKNKVFHLHASNENTE